MDDDHFELMLIKYAEKERDKSDGLYSRKIIERAVVGFFVLAATTVFGLVANAVWSLVAAHFK